MLEHLSSVTHESRDAVIRALMDCVLEYQPSGQVREDAAATQRTSLRLVGPPADEKVA